MVLGEDYGGLENLEVMQEAKNYNAFLLRTVCKALAAGTRTLDFGAGTGQFAAPVKERGADIMALEPDARLRERMRAQGLRVVGGLTEVDDCSVDYIYTLNVLEHIEDDRTTLQQLHSKLKRSGRLLIYVPAFPILYTSMDARVGHIRRYTRASLREAVLAAGFEIEQLDYVDFLGFFASLAFKLADNNAGTVNRRALKLYDRLVFPISAVIDVLTRKLLGKNLLLLARKV